MVIYRNRGLEIYFISKNAVNEYHWFAKQNGIMQKIKSINNDDDDDHASSLRGHVINREN